MASAKSRRYGQGGSKHKHTLNANRPNGKAWKKYPKAFNTLTRSLVTSDPFKGTTGQLL